MTAKDWFSRNQASRQCTLRKTWPVAAISACMRGRSNCRCHMLLSGSGTRSCSVSAWFRTCPRFLLATWLVANRFLALQWLVGWLVEWSVPAVVAAVVSVGALAVVLIAVPVVVAAAVSVGALAVVAAVELAVAPVDLSALVGAFGT